MLQRVKAEENILQRFKKGLATSWVETAS